MEKPQNQKQLTTAWLVLGVAIFFTFFGGCKDSINFQCNCSYAKTAKQPAPPAPADTTTTHYANEVPE